MRKDGREEGPAGTVGGAAHSGLCHSLAEIVGVDEAVGVSGAESRMSQGLGEEALADAKWSYQQDAPVFVQKLRSTIHGYRQGNPALS